MPDAILLAGGGDEGGNKAFLTAAGRPFIWYVARALADAPSIGRVVAVGPVEDVRQACGDLVAETAPEAGSITENVAAGLQRLAGAPRVLVAASDIPLLTADAVEDFLSACTNQEADFIYPIVPQSIVEDRYPGIRKNFIRMVDGSFTGGNVFLFNPAVMSGKAREFIEALLVARKKPWLMAKLFGWNTVMKFASGRVSIRELEEKAQEIMGIPVRALTVRRPEVAVDADVEKPENLAIIRRALEGAA